jgi:hypothetical protein
MAAVAVFALKSSGHRKFKLDTACEISHPEKIILVVFSALCIKSIRGGENTQLIDNTIKY